MALASLLKVCGHLIESWSNAGQQMALNPHFIRVLYGNTTAADQHMLNAWRYSTDNAACRLAMSYIAISVESFQSPHRKLDQCRPPTGIKSSLYKSEARASDQNILNSLRYSTEKAARRPPMHCIGVTVCCHLIESYNNTVMDVALYLHSIRVLYRHAAATTNIC